MFNCVIIKFHKEDKHPKAVGLVPRDVLEGTGGVLGITSSFDISIGASPASTSAFIEGGGGAGGT